MFQDLQPAVYHAVMSILVILYETGLVDEVDMNLVMRLFGAYPPEDPNFQNIISFKDEEWIKAYMSFIEEYANPDDMYVSDPLQVELDNFEQEEADDIDPDLSPNRKLHWAYRRL